MLIHLSGRKLRLHITSRFRAFLPSVMIALLCCITSCEKLELPVTHSLTDAKNNSLIPIQITGRTKTHVDFVRLKDSKSFTYPISKLTPEDQKFVRGLAIMQTGSVSNPAYIQSRLAHISKLKKDITRLEHEMETERKPSAPNVNHSKFKEVKNTLYQRHAKIIADKKHEITELESDIKIYRLDH